MSRSANYTLVVVKDSLESLLPRGLLWGNLIRDLMLEKDYFVVTSTREKRGVLYLEDDQFGLSSISASLGKISSMIDDNKRRLE